MNEDNSNDRSPKRELEQVLRRLVPRESRLDCEAICEQATVAVLRSPARAGNRLNWWTFSSACAASALIGAAVTFSMVQGKIEDLSDQLARMSEVSDATNDHAGDATNGGLQSQVDAASAVVKTDAAEPMSMVQRLPLLANDEARGGLVVGSHLKRVAFQRPAERSGPSPDSLGTQKMDDAGHSPAESPGQSTRASLIADLLDT